MEKVVGVDRDVRLGENVFVTCVPCYYYTAVMVCIADNIYLLLIPVALSEAA